MKTESQSVPARLGGRIAAAANILTGLLLAGGAATSAYAQGQMATGLISGSGSGPYNYTLTFDNAANATSPIGSVWYAWTPGQFYLPGTPASASAPAGWTATVSGASVQYVATTGTFDIPPGGSLSGFGYQASFSPAQLAAAPNSGLSVAYSGGLFSDAGVTFDVAIQAVPEPSTLMLACCGLAGLGLFGYRRSRVS